MIPITLYTNIINLPTTRDFVVSELKDKNTVIEYENKIEILKNNLKFKVKLHKERRVKINIDHDITEKIIEQYITRLEIKNSN